jgi:transglutaminase-like putative cysteine protease
VKYRVRHITNYEYHDAVPLCQNQAHLSPRVFERQQCQSTHVTVQPEPTAMHPWVDYFGNSALHFAVEVPHDELTVTAESIVTVTPPRLPAPATTAPWEQVRDATKSSFGDKAVQFTFESPLIRFFNEARDYARPSFTPGRPILEAALDLTSRIFREFKYDPSATCVNTPTEDVLRALGLAARYVSGYLLTEPPPGQTKLVGADASHAWVSVYSPQQRAWFDLDPTNNQMPQLRHVTLAWGRDYSDVCPIKGVFLGGGDHRMYVSVDVAPTTDN